MQAKVITVHIQKGGAGKTTMTSFIGGALAARGYKVLMIDTDKQKNLTINHRLKFSEDDENLRDKNVYNFVTKSFDDDFDAFSYVQKTPFEDVELYMVPAAETQGEISKELDKKNFKRLQFVNKAIEPLRGSFDFIIIDCGLDLDVLSYNCYQASDYIVIPANPEPNTRDCVAYTYGFLMENMEERPSLRAGLVFTNVDSREAITHTIVKAIENGMQDICKIFNAQIRRDTNVKQAQDYRVPLSLFMPRTTAARNTEDLIDELLMELIDACPEKMEGVI